MSSATDGDRRIALGALLSGALFGLGLSISQMINPAKVLNFLDVAGYWDPSLLFVLGGAVLVTLVGFRWVLRRPAPVFGGRFHLSGRKDIDATLLGGAALFGIGWGLGGFCPGPALAALATLRMDAVAFVVAMIAGAQAFRWLSRRG